MKPLEILLFEARNGFFKARVTWMRDGKERRGYTVEYDNEFLAASQAVDLYSCGLLDTLRDGGGDCCGRGNP